MIFMSEKRNRRIPVLKGVAKCTNSSHLDISAANHNAIHLLEGQLGSLWHLVLDEGEALMFVCDRIPRQIDTFDRAKGQEGLFDRVFSDLKVNTAYIDPAKIHTQEKKTQRLHPCSLFVDANIYDMLNLYMTVTIVPNKAINII